MSFPMMFTIFSDGKIWVVAHEKNIARGTTDPEIDSETWTNNNMAPLALVANLATRWTTNHKYDQ